MPQKILSIARIRSLMKKGTPMIFGTDLLQSFYEYGQEALKITMELNNKYHTPEKVPPFSVTVVSLK